MSAPVFLAEPGTLDAVTSGGLYLLDGSEGRHAGVVQRRAPGERVDVVDGAGVRVCGRVARVTATKICAAPAAISSRAWNSISVPAPNGSVAARRLGRSSAS